MGQDGEFITTDCCGPIEDCFLTNFGDTWTALEPYNSYDPFFTDDEVFRGPDHTGIFFRNDFASYYLEYPSFYSYDDPIAYSGFWTAFTAPPPWHEHHLGGGHIHHLRIHRRFRRDFHPRPILDAPQRC